MGHHIGQWGRKVKPANILLLIWVFIVSMYSPTETERIRKTSVFSPSPCEGTEFKTRSLGCVLETNYDPRRPPKSDEEPKPCEFFDENFQRAYCNVERDMHQLVRQIIRPTDTVLELGGRYGSTTCMVAEKQNNSGALIVVEPDPKVWAIHEFNKLTHNCASWSVFGVLGKEDVKVLADSEFYNTRTSGDKDAEGVMVRHYTWDNVERVTGLKVDTVIMDCEGCWVDIVRENLDKFRNVNTVILENDNDNSEKTVEGFKLLESVGLTVDRRSTGELQILASMFVFSREGGNIQWS